LLDFNQSQISKFEHGVSLSQLFFIRKVAEILKVSIPELFDVDEEYSEWFSIIKRFEKMPQDKQRLALEMFEHFIDSIEKIENEKRIVDDEDLPVDNV